ncbi:peptidoglycan-binding domain-containing protein, partial [Paralimibaculum aggregatum]|uniref:peptidoglycan-binding domain-containing protein n=1 Tax=Paralimibaculum aggregatum TaxID=3036245 RepID=UPI002555E430
RPRPPGYRPPHYRPPHWRPPAWRPPYFRPPYYRPPHYRWGSYYWYPAWGWYFTAAVAGGTLAYVLSLPADDGCEQLVLDGETLYECNGVLYRSTLHDDEEVYEIVSSQDDSADAPAVTPAPAGPAGDELLRLNSPIMRGERVRALQMALNDLGYDVGGVDGAFGAGTDRALRRFQTDNGLTPNGIVDEQTAVALGI